MYLLFSVQSIENTLSSGLQILEQKLISGLHTLTPSLVHLPKEIEQMVRALYEGDAAVDALARQALVRPLALLPRDQVVGRAVDQERRRCVGPALDLGAGANDRHGRRRGLRHLVQRPRVARAELRLAGEAVDEHREALRLPIHVQHEAPAWILERHDGYGHAAVDAREVARDLVVWSATAGGCKGNVFGDSRLGLQRLPTGRIPRVGTTPQSEDILGFATLCNTESGHAP